jgi:fatty-acyl-CoA synthase
LPHVESKIINEEGEIVAVNTPGELCVRGYLRMNSYFNDPEKTKETIDSNGWLYTGDLAQVDERGYLRIVGRKKDMIIR